MRQSFAAELAYFYRQIDRKLAEAAIVGLQAAARRTAE